MSVAPRPSDSRARAAAPAPQADARLRLLGLGESAPGEHRFALRRIAVGSGVDNDLVIAHPTVSRKHAVIREESGSYVVEDLASTNGTFVNRRRIAKPTRIRSGDEVGFGATRYAVASPSAGAVTIRRSPMLKRSLGAAGILLFALAGFVGARYVIASHRIGLPAHNRASSKNGASPQASSAAKNQSPSEGSIEPTPAESAEGAAPEWLTYLNDFRTAAGLGAVSADPNLNAGDRDHALYLVNNYASEMRSGGLGAQAHIEDVHLPWYTPQGAEAARSSDEAEQVFSGKKHPDPQLSAINGWMTTPFHRLFILSPLLRTVGFGFDCENDTCVELLNVLSGADPMPRAPMPLERPILFPPDGGAVAANMRTLESEWPTPISGCDGYAFPVGLAITAELGPMVEAQLDSFTLTGEDGATLEACGFDANSYRNPNEDERSRVVSGLRAMGAVVIVPRAPLDAGARYDVDASVNGRDYKWSFSVKPRDDAAPD